ncbi:histidinol-phosphate transaminase [Sphingomonas piscis]|uniref:histidinol-phosphate transaminase n=1 Tax=Sphingomonas piscis TaxID=2714943 RepID=UPI001FE74A77|nr:histidinol-phosphate transaminase [Sphingomonas piscis]
MTSVVQRLARPEILALPEDDKSANANAMFGADAIKLDANESPYEPLTGGNFGSRLNRYPEPQPSDLRAAMAALYGVTPANLLVTRGADDAIDVLVRSFCRAGVDKVSICTPTFSAYAQFARIQGAEVVEIPLDEDFDFDPQTFLTAARAVGNLKLAFICTPNNPTGNPISPETILQVAEALPDTIIVADEAYIEFADQESLAPRACEIENLVILRTLSKAFGLAGARVGCLIGTEELVALTAKALPPYPMPTPSIQAALAALAPSKRMLQQQRVAETVAAREQVAQQLGMSPLVKKVRNGGGNFVLIEVDDAPALARKLQQLGVRVRFRPNVSPHAIRLTIGSPEENVAALSALGVNLEQSATRRAEVIRETNETKIAVAVDLDRTSPRTIETGLPFFDHMLDQIAAHGGFSLLMTCKGDLEIDAHHSVEDCAIALGQALYQALGDRRGIGRYGFALPMDEAEGQALIDLSGRPYGIFEGEFTGSHIGDYPTEMTPHFFRSLAEHLRAAVHVKVTGDNDHHKVEAAFKVVGRALRQAIAKEGDVLPSTKGML